MAVALYRLAAAFGALAIAAAVAAYALPPSCGIEGAYFDRSTGAPAVAAVLSDSGPCWAPDVLLGAAGAFLVCGVAVALAGRGLKRRAAS